MASAYPHTRQRIEPSAAGLEHPCDGRDSALARSLQSALDKVESLHLYARSIVRMLETCEAEASLSRPRSRGYAARGRRRPMDLDYVREDVDRLAGEVQAQLALLRAGLPSAER